MTIRRGRAIRSRSDGVRIEPANEVENDIGLILQQRQQIAPKCPGRYRPESPGKIPGSFRDLQEAPIARLLPPAAVGNGDIVQIENRGVAGTLEETWLQLGEFRHELVANP